MINPTVGRVVWIRNRPESLDKSQPEKADIVYVHGIDCINVAGYNANGEPFRASSVLLRHTDSPDREGMYAEWMPYQTGQAAKTEAAEAELAKAREKA
jgi:hypothetical protein